MQKTTGAIVLLIGVAVLVGARKIANYFGAEVQPIFTGAPTDRAVYLYVIGVVIALLGVVQFFWKPKK
jgi:nitrogen fixation-related uncharacterized protein